MKKGKETRLFSFKSKLGQATIFVIIAVLLIGAVGITLFLTKKQTGLETQFSTDPQIQSRFMQVKTSVSDCLKFTSQDALDFVGLQGGYYERPKDSFDFGVSFIPYYYLDGKTLMPANSEIQNQLALYVDDNLKDCIDNINNSEFKVTYLPSETTAQIKSSEVVFNVNMPVTIQKDSKSVKLELGNEAVTIPSKLQGILEIAKFITDSHKDDPEFVCLNCISDMAEERDVYVDMVSLGGEGSTLVIISENSTSEVPYTFEFLNKYSP